jgi:hypothetical protein
MAQQTMDTVACKSSNEVHFSTLCDSMCLSLALVPMQKSARQVLQDWVPLRKDGVRSRFENIWQMSCRFSLLRPVIQMRKSVSAQALPLDSLANTVDRKLDNSQVTVQVTLCYVLEMFCERLEQEGVHLFFLDPLVRKLAAMLEATQKLSVQEMVITALAATAVAAEDDFGLGPNFARVAPLMCRLMTQRSFADNPFQMVRRPSGCTFRSQTEYPHKLCGQFSCPDLSTE